ncbi:MAG: tRNA (adenosine(37)-N6)-threonylcarbamoyltransferase complex dimerization subunit type 1 TsaB [Hyphomicrobiaceae bacterium]
MNILAFDTCFAACSAAAGRAPATADSGWGGLSMLFEPMDKGHAERLPSMIAEVMQKSGLAFSELDRIAVTNGPGSFTGSRMAVAAARALGLGARRDIVAVSSLAVMAARAARLLGSNGLEGTTQAGNSLQDGGHLSIAVDARRGEVYVQQFLIGELRSTGPLVEELSEPLLMTVEEAAKLGGDEPMVLAGSAAASVAQAAERAGRRATASLPELLPHAQDLAVLGARMEPLREAVRPLYMRPADAKPQVGKSIERASS